MGLDSGVGMATGRGSGAWVEVDKQGREMETSVIVSAMKCFLKSNLSLIHI